MATTFINCASSAEDANTLWSSSAGLVTSQSSVVHSGPNAYKLNTSSPAVQPALQAIGVVQDSGTRFSFWINFPSVSPAVGCSLVNFTNAAGTAVVLLGLSTGGQLIVNAIGASASTGSTVLSTNTWYRVSFVYTITNSTTYSVKAFINGVQEISFSNTGTLTNTTTNRLLVNIGPAAGVNFIYYADDIYIDNSNSLTDPGNIYVTAKRPNANGTTNGFTTQIGSGGSGYGTGHSPQVNERPVSLTNGWSIATGGVSKTEEYNIEGRATGDTSIAYHNIVDYTGWVVAKSLSSETASLVLNNVTSNISLTSTVTSFQAIAGSTTYPAGTGTTLSTTVSLYECGVMVAYIPSGGIMPVM